MLAKRRTGSVVRLLGWDEGTAEQYGQWRSSVDSLVGLAPLKAFVRQRVKDVAGRTMLGDTRKLRHVLVFGAHGAGKSTAAERLSDMFQIMGDVRTHGDDEVPEWEDGKWESKERHAYRVDLEDWSEQARASPFLY